MMTADLATKETEIQERIIYGDSGIIDCDPRPEALGSVKYLYTDLTDIRKFYIRLGFHLDEFDCCGYYEDFGYDNLYDFCENNLGLDKSAVSRCINVYREFNASGETKYISGTKSSGCAMELADRWKNYSYTQLCEMLPLSDEDRKKILPDMTVKQIREFKKELKGKNTVASTQQESPEEDTEENPVASTQPEEEKKPFDNKLYESLTFGIFRQNVVKNCSPVKENVVATIFDKDGKFVYGNTACDLIYAAGGDYYFRLWDSKKGGEEK